MTAAPAGVPPSGVPPGKIVARVDGGSRGNPGPAGYGVVIEDPAGVPHARLKGYLGTRTNNYAEYQGLLAALRWALDHGVADLEVRADSELMVRQMLGRYRVHSPLLQPLHAEARHLAASFRHFSIRHVPREANREADGLANEAMDEGQPAAGGADSRPKGRLGGGGSTNSR